MHLIILVGVLAALITFLYFNWNPSRMYMGDTGSQFLGAFLAAIGIMYIWNDHYSTSLISPARQFIIAIMAFILPVIDTTVVVYNRVSKGKSPFIGGKDHTTHSLAYLGFSDRQVAITFLALSFISILIIYFIETFVPHWSHTYTLIFGLYFSALLSFFFIISRKAAARHSADSVMT